MSSITSSSLCNALLTDASSLGWTPEEKEFIGYIRGQLVTVLDFAKRNNLTNVSVKLPSDDDQELLWVVDSIWTKVTRFERSRLPEMRYRLDYHQIKLLAAVHL